MSEPQPLGAIPEFLKVADTQNIQILRKVLNCINTKCLNLQKKRDFFVQNLMTAKYVVERYMEN